MSKRLAELEFMLNDFHGLEQKRRKHKPLVAKRGKGLRFFAIGALKWRHARERTRGPVVCMLNPDWVFFCEVRHCSLVFRFLLGLSKTKHIEQNHLHCLLSKGNELNHLGVKVNHSD